MRTGSRQTEPPEAKTPGRKARNSNSSAWSGIASGYCLTITICCAAGSGDYAPKTPDEEWHPLFVEALQKQSHVEYLLDVLLFSDMRERAALIASYGKEVRNLERRMADLAARTAAGRDGHHRSRTPAPER